MSVDHFSVPLKRNAAFIYKQGEVDDLGPRLLLWTVTGAVSVIAENPIVTRHSLLNQGCMGSNFGPGTFYRTLKTV